MIKKILLSAILVVSAVQLSMGQETEASQPLTININGLLNMDYESEATNTFDFITLAQLTDGINHPSGKFSISSNLPWTVTATVDIQQVTSKNEGVVIGNFIRYVLNDGEPTKESFLPVKEDGSFTFSGSRGANRTRRLHYLITPGYDINPTEEGGYVVNISYTLTQD